MIFDCLEEINTEKVVDYVLSLKLEDGSFMGDKFGEVDNRFTFCAVACLALLGNSIPDFVPFTTTNQYLKNICSTVFQKLFLFKYEQKSS